MLESTQIVVDRIHHYRDTIRSYHVEIDGQRVGLVRDNDHVAFEVTPGQHVVRLRLLWISSPKYLVEVAPGTESWVTCGPNGGILQAWRLFLAPATAIFINGREPRDHETSDVEA